MRSRDAVVILLTVALARNALGSAERRGSPAN